MSTPLPPMLRSLAWMAVTYAVAAGLTALLVVGIGAGVVR
jgi:hypothetical protein